MNQQSNSSAPIALTLPAAAKSVGVSARTIQKFITSGELPSVLIGKRRLIRRVDLEAFIEARIVRMSNQSSAEEPLSRTVPTSEHSESRQVSLSHKGFNNGQRIPTC